MNERKVYMLWDGGPSVQIPLPMGNPRPDQMQGTLAEDIAELSCRVCYDSLGSKRSRNSEENLKHVIEVGHLSVLEHYHATFLLFITQSVRGPVIEALAQRPGVYFRTVPGAGPGAVRITMNARAMLEWSRRTQDASFHQAGYPNKMATFIGIMLQAEWNRIAPVLCDEAAVPPMQSELASLGIGTLHQTQPEHPSEVWLTLYMEGSRGFSHELVRHGDFTAISQRSTRYVNEADSEWDWHPLIEAFLSESGPGADRSDMIEALTKAQSGCQEVYRDIVRALQPWLTGRGVDKFTARKQARGAARGFLGNALRTAVIFSASVPQWRHMMRMRAADAADAEIRMIFSEALPLLKGSCYGTMFDDLQLTGAGDGLGLSLAGGGAQ